MNNQKKKTMNPRMILIAVAAVLLVVVLAVLGLEIAGNSQTDPTGTPNGPQTTRPVEQSDATEPSAGETTPSQTQPDLQQPEDLAIDTPYTTLFFPGEWEEFLVVEQSGEPLTVRFSAKLENGSQQELFALTFGEVDETTAGVLKLSDGSEIAVNVAVTEFIPGADWTEQDATVAYAMQEEVNHILNALPLTDPSPAPDTQTEPVEEDIIIGTPWCELRYPSKWKEQLELQIDEDNGYSVGFYCALEGREKVHLFTIHLGGDQGVSVMTLDTPDGSVELRLTISEFSPDSSWTSEESSIVYAMQEDLNYLLGQLMD